MCVAPPAHVGAWSMAVLLGQPFEFYYYYYYKGHNGGLNDLDCNPRERKHYFPLKQPIRLPYAPREPSQGRYLLQAVFFHSMLCLEVI